MANLNVGSSVYHEIQVIYTRSLDGDLLAIEGNRAPEVSRAWFHIRKQFEREPQDQKKTELFRGAGVQTFEIDTSQLKDSNDRIMLPFEIPSLQPGSEHVVLRAHEKHRPGEDQIIGILSVIPSKPQESIDFQNWARLFVLSETRFPPSKTGGNSSEDAAKARDIARHITNIFDDSIRNIAPEDQWISGGGQHYFEDRVLGFVERKTVVEFCLPAFPCKSSNRQKTSGIYPDRAEKIALDVLYSFARSVAAVYEPGAKIWIISDGHVFSDCIGVDDDVVDSYGRKLQEMQRYGRDGPQAGAVEFLSLYDLFFANQELSRSFDEGWVASVQLPHFVETGRTHQAELCRRVLMAFCQIDPEVLNGMIKGGDKASLALYRGFSRFMLEDLAEHPGCIGRSVSQRKKLSTKVAAEMIKFSRQRNQAYSNLVELLFPSHIRLSIHAHNNRGPKFGVRLFPKNRVRAIDSLGARGEPRTADLLHTPTPWHNCIIKFEGDATLYLTKTRVAHEALNDNGYRGSWVGAEDCPNGRYFLLRKQPRPPVMMADSGKGIMPQSQVVDVSRSEYQQITVLENMTLVQT